MGRAESGVVMVPAFVGLGAPWWDADARGALFGLTRDTGPADLARAALEAAAHQTADLLDAAAADGVRPALIRIDGGMSANDWFAQTLADVVGLTVERPAVTETTAWGAAVLAGLGVGAFSDPAEAPRPPGRRFTPPRRSRTGPRPLGRCGRAHAHAVAFKRRRGALTVLRRQSPDSWFRRRATVKSRARRRVAGNRSTTSVVPCAPMYARAPVSAGASDHRARSLPLAVWVRRHRAARVRCTPQADLAFRRAFAWSFLALLFCYAAKRARRPSIHSQASFGSHPR